MRDFGGKPLQYSLVEAFLDHFVVASNVAHSVLQDILLHACIFGVFLGQGESCYLVTSLESGTRSSEPHTASAESA